MGWSAGKTRGAVGKLEAEGLVKMEKAIQSGRAVNLIKSTPWQEMLTPEELEALDNMEF